MKTKLSGRFWCAVTLFSLIGQVAWVVENMYFNVFIYKMFSASAADISLMVAASAVTATLTTVFIGALSDKIGKRKLFICSGYILWGISILSFAFLRIDVINKLFPMAANAAAVGVSLVIIFDCIMTFFGSTANDAAFNAWLTDSVESESRGAVEGINAMMPLVAILVVFGSFMFFDLEQASSWIIIFTAIGAVVLIIGILGIFLIKEKRVEPAKEGYFRCIFHGFMPKTVKQNPLLYIVLSAFAVFNISIQIFMPYLIIYYEKSLMMSDYVIIMAPAIILASVFTAVWGKIYDKKDFKFSCTVSILLLAAGYLLLFFTKTRLPVFIGSLLMMCGYLSGMADFGAMIRDNIPENKAGMFQGLRIFSQVLIPGTIGPFIGAAVLSGAETVMGNDGTQSFLPNANIFLAALLVLLPLALILFFLYKSIKPRTTELYTPFEENKEDVPFSDHPRPQLRRDSFICLNGEWELSVIRKGRGLVAESLKVKVPYPVGSRLSGIDFPVKKNDTLEYSRFFSYRKNTGKKLFLHFGAVDQTCSVFVNDKKVGEHIGGYLPFSFDITEFSVDGDNLITVLSEDRLDTDLGYGKQTFKRGGMWYTPISGIWQTVWLEEVPEKYIEDIRLTPDLKGVDIEVFGGEEEKTVIFEGKEYSFRGDLFRLEVKDPKYWTPENPKLYDLTVISGEDRIETYFALRTVQIKEDKILLNGKPCFFHGLLDQGYFSDGIYLPATSEGFKTDILKMKELGFNMLRKHIKIEPEIFYYYCDKYGMIVFQDFVNSGRYSFLIDTALPTVGLRKGISHKASKKRREAFIRDGEETVRQLYNHPCVCCYTIFNEGWGQFDAADMYEHFRVLDKSRVWDATSGWFQTGKSDVLSEHIYFKPIKLKNDGRPLILSEFGGYSLKVEGHSFNLDKNYGYKTFKNEAELSTGLKELYFGQVIPAIREQGLAGAVLTQVSDVEDETNGLLTYDRQVLKVDAEEMKVISDSLYAEYDAYCKKS